MIKLNRTSCPSELTDQLKSRLTQKYKSTGADVWNEDCIKPHLKNALLNISHEKCSYCECRLNIESNDATIDHIIPKSADGDRVLEWENLIISCLRCNRQKNAFEERIINPCIDNPQEHLYFVPSRYMINGKRNSPLGILTVETLDLNNIERIRRQRFTIGEKVKEELCDLYTKIDSRITKGWNPVRNDVQALMGIMEEALPTSDYSATVATILIHDENYNNIKNILNNIGWWSTVLEELHRCITRVKLSIIDEAS